MSPRLPADFATFLAPVKGSLTEGVADIKGMAPAEKRERLRGSCGCGRRSSPRLAASRLRLCK